MDSLMNHPVLICVLTFGLLWVAARLGTFFRKRSSTQVASEEYGVVFSATLGLLGLLIGFSFSMAVSRYDLRKSFEEEEANAIGTEYLRADLLPETARVKVKLQLVKYLELRIQKYESDASKDTRELNAKTAQLRNEMWNEVNGIAANRTDHVMASVLTGMNDVINRQGYTQAARWNRLPLPAWGLMSAIALFCSFLIGWGEKSLRNSLLLIVPLAIAVSFQLIADIDSPQGGSIRVLPQNLIALDDSLKSH